jgi:hypothetical protein
MFISAATVALPTSRLNFLLFRDHHPQGGLSVDAWAAMDTGNLKKQQAEAEDQAQEAEAEVEAKEGHVE